MQIAGSGQKDGIAVDNVAGGIAEKCAVSVAVESYAEIELASVGGDDLAQSFRM